MSVSETTPSPTAMGAMIRVSSADERMRPALRRSTSTLANQGSSTSPIVSPTSVAGISASRYDIRYTPRVPVPKNAAMTRSS